MSQSEHLPVLELLCTFLAIALITWYLYYLYCFSYWKRRGVPFSAPRFPAGNITKSILGKESLSEAIQRVYHEFKNNGHRHGGMYFFNGPVYVPVDPQIVKSILTTDFDHFVDRGDSFGNDFPLNEQLFALNGARWKNLRAKLSPAFSSGKLKHLYQIFVKITEKFIETVEPVAERGGEINIKYVATNFTCDIISSTALGLDSNTLKNPDNEIARTTFNMFNPSTWSFYKTVLKGELNDPWNLLKVQNGNKTVEDFFIKLITETVQMRDERKIVRNDILGLLLEIRDKVGLTFNEVIAQCFVFFLGGFETSSQVIAFCIHELAHNQDLQEKLRNEIFENMGEDFTKFSYDDILKLPYLDKVFNETLRLYPVLGYFNRLCVKKYNVPGTNVTIEQGTPVLIPILALQRDPEYYPEPFKFDPERFSNEQTLTPFTYLPFGEGPRFCIGMRYGALQAKLGIAALVSQFKFSSSSKTPKHIEIDQLTKTLSITPIKGITVTVSKL